MTLCEPEPIREMPARERSGPGQRTLQVGENLVGVLVAIVGIAFQATHDDAHQPVRQIRLDEFRALGLFLNPLVHHFQSGFAGERDVAGHQFIEDQAVGIEVGAIVGGLAFHLLRRHVTRRAEEGAGTRHADRAFFEGFREAKIADENLVVFVNQEVLRLQVAMDDAFGMRGCERLRDLPREIQNAVHRHLGIVVDDVLQILALDEGHGDEAQAADIAHVVNAQDIFVGDLAGENQFLFEALQRVGLADGPFTHHLDGDGAVQFLVVRFVNAAHAALAEQRVNAIARTEIAPGSDDGGVHHLNGFGLPQGHGSPAARTGLREVGINRAAVRAIDHGKAARTALKRVPLSAELSGIPASAATIKCGRRAITCFVGRGLGG